MVRKNRGEQLALLGRTFGELRAEFSAREPGSSALTWYEPDQTVGFWIRRMAQETVVHRIDLRRMLVSVTR